MPKPRQNKNDADTYRFWMRQIEDATKRRDAFYNKGDKIVTKYRGAEDDGSSLPARSRYNILYSNTETYLPLLYNNTPKAEVRSKRTTENPAYAEAAEILEAALDNSIDAYDFDNTVIPSVKDFLLPGSGQVRIEYKPLIDRQKEEDDEELIFEEVVAHYVYWKDFLHSPCRKWEDVWWVAYRHMMTYEDLLELAPGVADKIKLSHVIADGGNTKSSKGATSEDGDSIFAEVWEIWDKNTRERLYITDGYTQKPIAFRETYGLRDFFPSPRPMLANTTTDSLEPVPFFKAYSDQAMELDEVTSRITALTRELKRRGVYNAEMPEVRAALMGGDNSFEAVDNWPSLAERGGLTALVQELDISTIANVLTGLYNQRQELLNIIFQIAGLSDILRGSTDPRETAKAQRIKSQFGVLRINKLQREVQRFVRDVIAIKGEIIAENFSADTLALMADVKGIDEGGEVLTASEYVELHILPILRNQEPRSVAVNIESDSTISADEQEEQQRVVDYVQMLTGLVQATASIQPVLGEDVISQLFMDVSSKFKMSRTLLQKFEDRAEELKKQAEENEGQKEPDIDRMRLEAEVADNQAKNQLELAKLQIRQQELQLEAAELQLKQGKAAADIDLKQQEVDIKAINSIIRRQALDVEAANPADNAVAEAV